MDATEWRNLIPLILQIFRDTRQCRDAELRRVIEHCEALQGKPEISARVLSEVRRMRNAHPNAMFDFATQLGLQLDLDIDKRFSDFAPETEVGRGGTGVVYKALDRTLGRTVALKILRPDRAVDVHLQKRFIYEAYVTCKIERSGVAPV